MFSGNIYFSMHSMIFGCLLFISTCHSTLLTPFNVPYKLSKPDEIYKLKKSLNEVSGLNITPSGDVVLIDDERGSVFYYNLVREKVVRTIPFSKGGDCEDLYITHDTIYVLKSNGDLVELIGVDSSNSQVRIRSIDTGLHSSNDTEGLCYDPKRKMFLIACKGKPGLENFSEQYKGRKAIYQFNPKTRMLNTTPAILIDVHKVESMILGMQKNVIRRIMNLYSLTTKSVFQPSGIAVHPFTGDIYVISAVGNVLLVMDEDGKIKDVIKLSSKLFMQPEGITFDQAGNLFISNEGKSGKGNILKFSQKQI